MDGLEDSIEFAVEVWEERHSSALGGEGSHLIVRLEEIHLTNRPQCAHCCCAVAKRLHQTKGVDRNARLLNGAPRLVECQLAESIHAGRDQQDCLPSFNVL